MYFEILDYYHIEEVLIYFNIIQNGLYTELALKRFYFSKRKVYNALKNDSSDAN